MLDYDNPTGWSPAENGDYRCMNCPGRAPITYVLFPRSEIARVLDARQTVTQIRVRANGNFEITVGIDGDIGGHNPSQSYIFDSNAHLLSAEVVEAYVYAHNEMQKLGMVNHALDRKRESELIKPLLRWNGSGFSDGPPARPTAGGASGGAAN